MEFWCNVKLRLVGWQRFSFAQRRERGSRKLAHEPLVGLRCVTSLLQFQFHFHFHFKASLWDVCISMTNRADVALRNSLLSLFQTQFLFTSWACRISDTCSWTSVRTKAMALVDSEVAFASRCNAIDKKLRSLEHVRSS